MDRNSKLARGLYRLIEERILPLIDRHGLTADQLSWAGLAVSAAAGAAFVFSPAGGALLLLLAGLFDVVDGFTARSNGTASPAGAFLDSVLDRYGEVVVLIGVWGYLYRAEAAIIPATLLVFLALAGSFMVSYTRARGEGVAVSCGVGFFQRGERIVMLALGGLLDVLQPPIVMLATVALIGAGANMTAINRLRRIRRTLLVQKKGEVK